MRKRAKRTLHWILRDLILVIVGLNVFSLFHHVLPRRGEVLAAIAHPQASATAVTVEKDEEPLMVNPVATPVRATLEPSATPTPSPTPTPAPGDFSATFPASDTGIGADYSWQTDDVRIAVRKVQEDGITYFVGDVYVRQIEQFKTAFARGQYGTGYTEDPLKMAQDNRAVFAITGDYCGARSRGVVIRNGELYREKTYEDVCLLYYDGTMETMTAEEYSTEAAVAKSAWQGWSFGPQLLQDGKAIEKFPAGIRGKNPRAAIGYYAPGHYALVVVDGRREGYSDGMTLEELSRLFETLGCSVAYNLDGGGTAEMCFGGETISRPSGGGRASSDILYFGQMPGETEAAQ